MRAAGLYFFGHPLIAWPLLAATFWGLVSGAAPAVCGAAPVAAAPTTDAVTVEVSNPLRFPRATDTVVLTISDVAKLAPGLDAKSAIVVNAAGHQVDSQLIDLDGDDRADQLVFQSPFGPGEKRTFIVRSGERRHPSRDAFRVYGRFVRERFDDFAWENDRVAHRMYGSALETWKAEPLVSSGVDVWVKRVRKLVINDWYLVDDYHRDNGEGADLYSVGKSRGCGGIALWAGDKAYVSRNFVNSRVLANGPIRLVFELDYSPWDAGGQMVSETKRVTLDAGQWFNRFESVFKTEGPSAAAWPAMSVAIGIAKHEGGALQFDKGAGWMRTWEPLKTSATNPSPSNLGCAVVAPPTAGITNKTGDLDHLMIVKGHPGAAVTYYVGSAWDRTGEIANAAAWTQMVEGFAREVAAPLRVSLKATKIPAIVEAKSGASLPPQAVPAAADRTATSPGAAGGTAGASLGGGLGVGGSPGAALTAGAPAGTGRWSVRTCDSVMADGPTLTEKWAYDAGLVLQGCLRVWSETKDRRYFVYVKRSIDHLVDADGNIKGYRLEDYNLDNINMGKVLFPLFADSTDPQDKERYRKVLRLLRTQLNSQPRTADGAFWHKLIYPRQMWLDGVYMASPFLAEYGRVFNEPALVDEAARQILLAEKHMRDPKTGLLYHGWDESREQRWANPKTGTSPQFWGRAMGWYAMGIVDVLDHMPKGHPQREPVLGVLRRLATAVATVQDKTTGVWWQVLDAPLRGKNYEEASASSMFVYALGKGVKNGWLDAKKFAPVLSRGYHGVITTFAEMGPGGRVNVKNICKVAGLGGNPYRDGSFEYYTGTEITTNDFKGLGSFMLANAVNE